MQDQQKFVLKIIDQHWSETEPERFDLTSHGRLWLEIDGQVILDGREIYGLSESALALLRTLERNHSPKNHVAEKLIFHGCGYVLMQGCTIGADWTVLHEEGIVTLKDVFRWDTPDEMRPTRFENLTATLSIQEYQQIVLAFAKQVKQFFEGQEKEFISEADQREYENFWAEFDETLSKMYH